MKGWLGQRTPTVAPLAVTMSGTFGDFGSTIVRGPGQNDWASLLAVSFQSLTHSRANSPLATCTMIGLFDGRPLISKIFRTAFESKALPANPYTVSVGRPTTSPARSNAAARCTAASNFSRLSVCRISAIQRSHLYASAGDTQTS